MEIDAANRLLKERKFDPKEMGYGEDEDAEDTAFRKLIAEVGTPAEVLVGILGSLAAREEKLLSKKSWKW